MKLGLSHNLRLEQRLVQSPQMIQAMQILQLPTLDLAERIEQELGENPCLEVDEEAPREERPEPEAPPEESIAPEAEDQQQADPDRYLQQLEAMLEESGEIRAPRGSRAAGEEESDRRLEALNNTPERASSLTDELLSQLYSQDLSERALRIGEHLVGSLDARGYLERSAEELAAEIEMSRGDAPATPAEVRELIAVVRELGPPGIAAYDLRECLLLQLDALEISAEERELYRFARSLVVRHLDDILHNRRPKIARESGRSIDEVNRAIELLSRLDTRPGAPGVAEPNANVSPDVIVEEVDGGYEIRLDRGGIPELRISPAYRQLLEEARKNPEVLEYLRRKIDAAKWFIDAVHQRQLTLYKIAKELFSRQRDFLDHGISQLHPLRMQEVAEAPSVGVHISTVSRAIAGKYAQTPRGIFPLKWFFSGGTTSESGQVASQKSIKQRIADLLAVEDKKHPLSDDEIAAVLEKEDGLRIARRTVTKYRKALHIPSSTQRRIFE
ncbi:MAG: RNA polymerase factor sigma-54 [Planctomycetes bacterium]|nr:RNA polymerase factor sigma-54 [Planctomycetota bacterium]